MRGKGGFFGWGEDVGRMEGRRIAPALREWAYFASGGLGGMIYRLGCSEGVEGQNERAGEVEGRKGCGERGGGRGGRREREGVREVFLERGRESEEEER